MPKHAGGNVFAKMEERSCKLADEAMRLIASTGARTDKERREAFEAWAIHKLAALQVLVELLGNRSDPPVAERAKGPMEKAGTRGRRI